MWTFNNIRIFVQDKSEDGGSIIAVLQPLSGGSVYHAFGHITPPLKIEAIVVGDVDKNALIALSNAKTPHTLNSPWGSLGSYILKTYSFKNMMSICQTLRPDLDDDVPVYLSSLEFLNDN